MKIGYILLSIFLLVVFLMTLNPGCSSTSPSSSTPAQSNPSASAQTTSLDAEWQPDGVITPGEYSGSNSYGEYSINWRSDEQFGLCSPVRE